MKTGRVLSKREVDELVTKHVGLVKYVVAQYWTPMAPVEFEDLEQESFFALLRAAELYKPERGAFSTYARLWIRAYVLRVLKYETSVVGWTGGRRKRDVAVQYPADFDRLLGLTTEGDVSQLYEEAQLAANLEELVEKYPNERTRDIIKLRLKGETLSGIGRVMGFSRERARQLEADFVTYAQRRQR